MITRLEIDGFKSFRSFSVDFAPFQVIVGPNGAGKSNLFDALRLLSKLATEDLRSAIQALRGEAGELFARTDGGTTSPTIRFGVEMLVDDHVRDSWGAEEGLRYTRLRYDLVLERRTDRQGLERLYVKREQLEAIKRGEDAWISTYGLTNKDWLPRLKTGRSTPFISTQKEEESSIDTVYLHQDGHGGRKANVAEAVERTVLSSVINTEFPHAFAAREEMRRWRLLQFNPEVLRNPSPYLADQHLAPDGKNLPNVLARLQAEDPHIITDISRDVANLVPGVLSVDVEKDEQQKRYVVVARTSDDCTFSSRVLSDGTLRALALVTLKNDPEHHGVLMFEEPENGIHAYRLRLLVGLLREMTTDFADEAQVGTPLRQLLINTHSPVLVRHLIEQHASFGDGATGSFCRPQLVFAEMATRETEDGERSRVTRLLPIRLTPQLDLSEEVADGSALSIRQVTRYLSAADTSPLVRELRSQPSSA